MAAAPVQDPVVSSQAEMDLSFPSHFIYSAVDASSTMDFCKASALNDNVVNSPPKYNTSKKVFSPTGMNPAQSAHRIVGDGSIHKSLSFSDGNNDVKNVSSSVRQNIGKGLASPCPVVPGDPARIQASAFRTLRVKKVVSGLSPTASSKSRGAASSRPLQLSELKGLDNWAHLCPNGLRQYKFLMESRHPDFSNSAGSASASPASHVQVGPKASPSISLKSKRPASLGPMQLHELEGYDTWAQLCPNGLRQYKFLMDSRQAKSSNSVDSTARK